MIVFWEAFMKHKDKRISISKDVIDGIKSIKYLSWENIFRKKILEVRKKEYFNVCGIRISDALLAIFWNTISYLLLYTILTTYINKGHSIKDSNIFVIIALFNLLIWPLGILPWAIGNCVYSLVAYKRLKKFLLDKEIDENCIEKN